jgi:hypothetical protein
MAYFNPYDNTINDYEDMTNDDLDKKNSDINRQINIELLKEELLKKQQRIKQLELQRIRELELQNKMIKQKEEPEQVDSLFNISNDRVLIMMIVLLVVFCILQQQSYKSYLKDVSTMFLQNINKTPQLNIVSPVDTKQFNIPTITDSATGLPVQQVQSITTT